MARPKIHEHERRTTGLRLIEPLHDAVRAYHYSTGVPINRILETATERYMTELGYYDPDAQEAVSNNGTSIVATRKGATSTSKKASTKKPLAGKK